MADVLSDAFTITPIPAVVSDPFTIIEPTLDFGIPVGVAHPYRLRPRRFPRW